MRSVENDLLSYECDLTAERDRLREVNTELLAALEKTYALPFSPSNNGEQWDEGFKRGWDHALNQVFEIARPAIAKATA